MNGGFPNCCSLDGEHLPEWRLGARLGQLSDELARAAEVDIAATHGVQEQRQDVFPDLRRKLARGASWATAFQHALLREHACTDEAEPGEPDGELSRREAVVGRPKLHVVDTSEDVVVRPRQCCRECLASQNVEPLHKGGRPHLRIWGEEARVRVRDEPALPRLHVLQKDGSGHREHHELLEPPRAHGMLLCMLKLRQGVNDGQADCWQVALVLRAGAV
mmetsp:Transcript_43885/g.139073  ORF Transcript_43885/g.139073 Transcript_43885/m.139073 type:complete len:219 (+) Transcript_43885:2-658(+)